MTCEFRPAISGQVSGARICMVAGCGMAVHCKSLCPKHYQRMRANGDPMKIKNRERGTGTIRTDGYLSYEIGGRTVLAHVLIAEAAVGRRLPIGAHVHHVDGDRGNNKPNNLVVCPDHTYHKLLHIRQRALDACGHADWLQCSICKEWDAPENIRLYKPSLNRWHAKCWSDKHGKKRVTS